MANLFEAVETLARIKKLVESERRANPKLVTTPNGKPSVYFPLTIHGRTGMFKESKVNRSKKDPVPPKQ